MYVQCDHFLMPMSLSSDKLHLTMTKSFTFSGLRDALLAVTTFPAAENTLSDFELATGTGKTILTRCERTTCTTDKVRLINYEIFMRRGKTYLTFTFKGRFSSAILNFLLKVRQIATDDLHFIIC